MEIRVSSQDYLEAILVLENRNGNVRNIDIAQHMGYSKPSITNAINTLCKGGYVIIDNDKNISLTQYGKEIAKKVYAKHRFFKEYLISIGVDEKIAEQDACRMEHAISDQSFEKLKESILKK